MNRLFAATLALFASNALAVESQDFHALAAQCAPGVHVDTLSAIVLHESGAKPFAIGVNAKGVHLPRQPATKEEAISTANWLKDQGYNFDGGYGQVNVKNLDWLGMSVADLFDPCKNLAGAARVITDCFKRAEGRYLGQQEALHAALSCYNTGNFRDGFSNGYVLKVAANVNLDVPALIPVEKGSQKPLRLQPVTREIPVANVAKPLPDGIGDAFSRSNADAFGVKPGEAESADVAESLTE